MVAPAALWQQQQQQHRGLSVAPRGGLNLASPVPALCTQQYGSCVRDGLKWGRGKAAPLPPSPPSHAVKIHHQILRVGAKHCRGDIRPGPPHHGSIWRRYVTCRGEHSTDRRAAAAPDGLRTVMHTLCTSQTAHAAGRLSVLLTLVWLHLCLVMKREAS